MHRFALASLLCLSVGLTACPTTTDDDDGEENFDLTLSGTEFAPHEGQTVYVAIADADDPDHIEATGDTTVYLGDFSVTFAAGVHHGSTVNVDHFADVDGDGACTAGTDHVWRVTEGPIEAAVTVEVVHNTDFEETACASFE